jgi:hypothetical protein
MPILNVFFYKMHYETVNILIRNQGLMNLKKIVKEMKNFIKQNR